MLRSANNSSVAAMSADGRREASQHGDGAARSTWSSQRVLEKKKHAHPQARQRDSIRRPLPSSSNSINGSISATPMRQARLKPPGGAIPIALVSSPSRGLDVGADSSQDLTNNATQQRFRQYITERIEAHSLRFGPLYRSTREMFAIPMAKSGDAAKGKENADALQGHALQSLQEVLLLVRKLREGCVAASRWDTFTLDVYLISSLCSLLLGDNIQLGSSLPRLAELFEELATSVSESDCQACRDVRKILNGNANSAPVVVTLDLVRALLLIWLSISGGHAERLGAATQLSYQRRGTSLAYHARRLHIDAPGKRVQRADRINAAIAHGDVIAIRSLLIDTKDDIWERALLRRVVDSQRVIAWTTLRKAYMHLAIDGSLLGADGTWPTGAGPSDWIERMLLIDLELAPPSEHEIPSALVATPDAWDEVDAIGADLAATSLHPETTLQRIRAERIATILSAYELPEATITTQCDAASVGLRRWQGRTVLQAGAPVLLLR